MPQQTHSRRLAESRIRIAWLPVLAAALPCALSLALWYMLERRELEIQRQAVQTEAARLADLVRADLGNRIPTLRRMSKRWAARGGVPKDEFISDASAYIEDTHGVQAIEWADKNGIVRWTAPVKGNELAQDLDLRFEPRRRTALEQSKNTRKPTATAPIELLEGGKGFLIYYPIYVGGESDGFILGVFRIREWLEYTFAVRDKGQHGLFGVSVTFDRVPVYANQAGEPLQEAEWDGDATTAFLGHRIVIRVRPTPAFLERSETRLPQLTALSGILFSLLMGFTVHLLLKTRRTTAALRASEERGALLLNSTAEAIYGIDLRGDCTFANPACCRMLGYAGMDQLLGRNMHELIHHSYPDGRPMPNQVCRIYQAFREGKGVHVDDEVLWRADGTSFPAEYWSYPQFVDGVVSGSVVAFIDITLRRQAEEALAAERERLAHILEGTNAGTWEWDVQTGETRFNERWAGILGYTLAELEPVSIATWNRLVHPDDAKVSEEALEKHFRKELPYYECEARMRHKDGSWVWVLDKGKVVEWTAGGKPLRMYGTHLDITNRKKVEEALRERIKELDCVYSIAGMAETASLGELFQNAAGLMPAGWLCPEEACARITFGGREFKTANFRETPWRMSASLDVHGKPHGRVEIGYLREMPPQDEGPFLKEEHALLHLIAQRLGKVVERRHTEERVRHLATHDALTDLPTMRLARDRLSMALGAAHRSGELAAVMFLDLDGFKEVNDTFGHEAGDAVLLQTAQRLRSCIRETDTAARIGGDEFLVIATGLQTPEGAAQVAEKIIRSLSRPVMCEEGEARVGASIGIALYPADGRDVKDLIRKADKAMYRVKGSGKNAYRFAGDA